MFIEKIDDYVNFDLFEKFKQMSKVYDTGPLPVVSSVYFGTPIRTNEPIIVSVHKPASPETEIDINSVIHTAEMSLDSPPEENVDKPFKLERIPFNLIPLNLTAFEKDKSRIPLKILHK